MPYFHRHSGSDRSLRSAPVLNRTLGLAIAALLIAGGAAGQTAPTTSDKTRGGYEVHHTVDLGGRIVDTSGSGAMYNTLVNLESGPRILSQTLDMHAAGKPTFPFFDVLTLSNSGYGGDPISVSALHVSKGKLYKFQGLFRRDRQYFDYNLLDNPLVPAGVVSNGYTFPQIKDSPHLFNTVRRMTDIGITILPLSKVSFRAGYSKNINQGPTYSSQHNGADALYLQMWRNSTDSLLGAVDWKPVPRTMFTYQQVVAHYKGDTTWQLAGFNMQLSNGTPVDLGFDNQAPPKCGDGNPPILSSSTTPPTANSTCSGYTHYSRTSPTRTLIPTEEFRFQSATLKSVEMSGSVRYTGASMKLPNYSESFVGLDNQGLRTITNAGNGFAERVSVSADFGIVWQLSERVSLSDQYDFSNFRQPADGTITEVDQLGSNMLVPLGPTEIPVTTSAQNFLGMKTHTNTATIAWEASAKASVSLGYRYQSRVIGFVMPLSTDALANGTSYSLPLHENGGILGVALQPTREWKIDGNVEVSYADNTYTQIDPRTLQRYSLRTNYRPKEWATISANFSDLERRNNVFAISHMDHSRSFSFGASLAPNPRYGLDLSYGYGDVFSRTTLCYASTPAPVGAGTAPPDCGTNKFLGNGFYDAPTHYGSFGVTLTPVKPLRASVGYRVNAINGTTEFLNPRQVPGSLQSKYQTPFANIAWTIHPGWILKGNWNYYRYGESGPVGPTLPRDFQSNVTTLDMHYEF